MQFRYWEAGSFGRLVLLKGICWQNGRFGKLLQRMSYFADCHGVCGRMRVTRFVAMIWNEGWCGTTPSVNLHRKRDLVETTIQEGAIPAS